MLFDIVFKIINNLNIHLFQERNTPYRYTLKHLIIYNYL